MRKIDWVHANFFLPLETDFNRILSTLQLRLTPGGKLVSIRSDKITGYYAPDRRFLHLEAEYGDLNILVSRVKTFGGKLIGSFAEPPTAP
ncbi:MAG: hypothetical protein ISR99_03150 [Parcubacteria group bacterium]|nr:hypothetical protein [Parcubacteria group bacterium]